LLPALTFAAPASVIVRAGGIPVFVDLDSDTWQMSMTLLRRFLTRCIRRDGRTINPNSGRVVSTLCVVHLWGGLADLRAISALAREFDLSVIQDAAQCLGARYEGAPFGHWAVTRDAARSIATTSFNANKLVTTGAGGALLCHDERVLRRAAHIASTAKTNPYSFEHDYCAVNYRMSNINAALGLAQIARFPALMAAKREIHSAYVNALSPLGLGFARPVLGAEPNHWASCVQLSGASEPVIRSMQRAGIQSRPTWVPLPRLSIYDKYETVSEDLVADKLWRTGVMLPAGPGLSLAELQATVHALRAALC
jgi:dTDP-4-amino-4,6-dideoxygalactose transaminase